MTSHHRLPAHDFPNAAPGLRGIFAHADDHAWWSTVSRHAARPRSDRPADARAEKADGGDDPDPESYRPMSHEHRTLFNPPPATPADVEAAPGNWDVNGALEAMVGCALYGHGDWRQAQDLYLRWVTFPVPARPALPGWPSLHVLAPLRRCRARAGFPHLGRSMSVPGGSRPRCLLARRAGAAR